MADPNIHMHTHRKSEIEDEILISEPDTFLIYTLYS